MMRKMWPALAAVAGLVWPALGRPDSPPAPLTTDAIVERMVAADQARTPQLREFTSLRHYSILNTRFGTRASMTVKMSFRYPATKEFVIVQESGPGVVRRKVFHRMLDSEREAMRDGMREATQISPRNYTFRLAGTRTLEGRACYVLEAEPKTKNQFLFRGRILVDAEDFAVAQIEGAPAQNPSFWVRKTAFVHRYGKFGPFWLALSNQSDTDVLVFGHTRVTIEYSDYIINPHPPEAAASPAGGGNSN